MTWDNIIKWLAGAAGVVAGLFGGWDTMIMVLVACMAIDYLSGCVVAAMGKSMKTESGGLDSKVGFIGLAKKMMIILAVLLGALVDRVIGQPVFRSMVIWFYIANEALSILENLALAGVAFPAGMKKALEQIKSKNDEPPDGFYEKEDDQ
jgi:toxin secretion/phage lysis holin